MSTNALNEAIYQNTPGNSDGLPVGLSWDKDASSTKTTPAPSGWSGLTAWGQVYQQAGASVSQTNASDTVQIADFTTYVHLTNGTWVKVQDQSQVGIGGAHYVADFSGDANIPWSQQTLPDGSVSVDAPPSGYNDHFWPSVRGTFTPGTVDGVFVEAQMKTSDPNANLVAQIGADWWRSGTAQYGGLNVNNTAVGLNDWTKLTTQWQTLYYTSLSPQQLQADPPPGLEPDSTAPTTPTTPPNVAPTVTQASASPGTGVEHAGDTITLTLAFSEAVTVTGTPTLSLNDGGKATYVGGSGTSSLTFKTTVASTDKDTSALAITGVNLPTGASIKDASGLAATLSGAVKTFTGLQIDATPSSSTSPTTPTSPTSPTSPSTVTKPALTIADRTLSVNGGGGTVDLGVKVTTTDPNDVVTVKISGLPGYETITDKLDGHTFRGKNITLTAAQVDSGLTLQSNYKGSADPISTLTLTASAKDPVTGAVATSAPQTITVKDPRPASATTITASQPTTTTDPIAATGTTTSQHAGSVGTVAASEPQPITGTDHPATAPTTPALAADHGSALFSHIRDLVAGGLANSAPQAISVTDHDPSANGKSAASLASQSFALLNQYLAGNTGRVDSGQIVAALSNGAVGGQDSFLTRPQH
ncbi:hypothetical protein [Bradyrhizobium neotropicale]|uniref:hypothetical protein n=1 Tax=Bradyrhizobium neotropicale TaxID=1497615 RepID=UPI001AD7C6EF|nr:hypothetical protein [Bradyrhizobium neotropicale]MBO4227690.1 hypothetical protein [Bradyrhizobium neotropicale]